MANRYYYKDYKLVDGLVYSANLIAQSSVLTFTDLPAEDTLCGLGISHMFINNFNSTFGNGFNLDIIERLVADPNVNADKRVYSYIDCFGNTYLEEFGYFKDYVRSEYEPNIVKSIPSYATINNLTGDERRKFRPIRWLFNDKIIKGFNICGNLVFICDRNGNYYHITGENYDSEEGEVRPTIIKMVPSDCTDYSAAKTVCRFEYNEDDMLTKITDAGGNALVSYIYDGYSLIKVTFKSGLTYSFEYMKGNIRQIETSTKFTVSITLTGISVMSSVDGVPSDNGTSTFNEISSYTFDYSANATTVTDNNGDYEKYIFNNGKLNYYYVYENGHYIAAENYTEENKVNVNNTEMLIKTTYKADRETLFGTDINSITFGNGEYEKKTYEKLFIKRYSAQSYYAYKLVKEEKNEYAVSLNTFNKYSITHEYHIDNNTGYFDRDYYSIDVYGRAKQIKRTVLRKYDKFDRITQYLSSFDDDSSLDEEQNYSYVGENYLAFPTRITSFKNNNENITAYTDYDVYGRITQEKDVANRYKTYTYKADTRRISKVVDFDGVSKYYDYNSYGEPSRITLNDYNHSFSYTYGELTGINKPGAQIFDYGYGGKRNLTSVKYFSSQTESYTASEAGSYDYSTRYFSDGKGICLRTTKSDGAELCSFDGVALFQNTYYTNGLLKKQSDYVTDIFTDLTYNAIGRLTKVSNENLTEEYGYDSYGNIKSAKFSGAYAYTYAYTYSDNAANRLTQMTVSTFTVTPSYDNIGRSTGRTVKVGSSPAITQKIKYTDALPTAVSFGSFDDIEYKYDSVKNISQITSGANKTYYHYDKNNRLVREDIEKTNKTNIYMYDDDGNRTVKYVYDFTREMTDDVLKNLPKQRYIYQYGSGMRLMGDGKTNGYKYDADGNPTYYRGHNLTWSKGMLTSYAGIELGYDGYGRRISKKGITYTYDSNNRLIKQSNGLEFFYDDSGVMGFKYGTKLYTYMKNIQGDVTGIFDNADNKVIARYEYDAWGNFVIYDSTGKQVATSDMTYPYTGTPTKVWNLNPFRYRGYYYDIETGLYYLLNRYYDPQTGRFLSLDNSSYADPDTVNGLNLYLYCNNNPVMNVDPTGEWVLSLFLAAFIGSGVSFATSLAVQYFTTGTINWGQAGISALFGAFSGAFALTGLGGALGQFFIQGALSAGETISIAALDGQLNLSIMAPVVGSFLFGGMLGAISANGAAKEFKRILQIERSFIHLSVRDIRKGLPFFGTILKRAKKYIKVFLIPTAKSGATTFGVTSTANILNYWLQQLYDLRR